MATNGPAPIYFTPDRDSRLGSPVVVALAGETNHVPLLMGIEYSVTSTVPITVSAPEAMYATVIPDTDRSARVKWPIDFEFVETSQGTYTVNVTPYDPGGEFTWDRQAPSGGGAMLLSVVPSTSCGCWCGLGSVVSFNCSEVCTCFGNCQASGLFICEVASFSVTGGGCRCGHYEPPHEDETIPPLPDPSVGGLSVTFSKSAVIFEDAYTNAPNAVVQRRSTTTRLTISASGGVHGGSFTLSTQNLNKLTPGDGTGPLAVTPGMTLLPGQTYYMSFICSGIVASGEENDVIVEGTFIENDTGNNEEAHADVTVVRLEVEPITTLQYQYRHIIGVREECNVRWHPTVPNVRIPTTGEGYLSMHTGYARYQAPLENDSPSMTFEWGGTSYGLALSVVEPASIFVNGDPVLNRFGLGHNVSGGAGMELDLYVMPTNVAFSGIAIQEVPSDYKDPQGYFTNSYFNNVWSHTRERHAGEWHNISAANFFMLDDADMGDSLPRMTPEGVITNDLRFGWIRGTMNWKIPVGWNERNSSEDDTVIKSFQTYGSSEFLVERIPSVA